jgi:hypothetical protein
MSLVRSQLSGGYDSTHIYYNINITNNNNGANVAPPQVIFNETRNTPYLGNPSEYYMSVVRFSLETPSLPIWLPQVTVGQANINQTIYSFTLTYDLSGVTYDNTQRYVTFIPQNVNEPLPAPPLTFQDITSEYYYIYSIQNAVQMLNNALTASHTALRATINGLPGAPQLPSNNPPFFEYNPTNNTFILDADISGYNLDSTTYTPIKIFCNAPMFNLISSFSAFNNGTKNITNGKNYQLNMRYIKGQSPFGFNPGPSGSNFNAQNCIQIFQEYPTIPLWCPIQSMVFTTALLPVVPELTAIPVVFGSNSRYVSDGNNANISPVLTDFEVGLTSGFEFKPNITYTPAGEYRLTDLYGNTPLSALEVRVFWKDIFGNLHPFYLAEGCNASIKILFRKKIYNSPVY